MKKKNFHLSSVIISVKIISFSFCADFNLKTTAVKRGEIRGLKQFLIPCFLLVGKKMFQNN